jgi:hypothetical protein
MNVSNSISVYEAVDKMREISKKDGHFSFSFMSFSEQRANSHGIVEVKKAKLTTKDRKEHNCNANIMENYIDIDSGEQHRFYKPLIMFFNGQKVKLT